jgi:quinol monooxygenase YgiN
MSHPNPITYMQSNSASSKVLALQEGTLTVVSRYKDQATLDAHFHRDYFQEVGKQVEAEGLLAKPLNIMTVQPIGGFENR